MSCGTSTAFKISFVLLSISLCSNIYVNYNIMKSSKNVTELHDELFYYIDKFIYLAIYLFLNVFIFFTPLPINKGNNTSHKNLNISDFYTVFLITLPMLILNIMFYTMFLLDEEDDQIEFENRKLKVIMLSKIIMYSLLLFLSSVIFLQKIGILSNDFLCVEDSKYYNKIKKMISDYLAPQIIILIFTFGSIFWKKLLDYIFES